MKKNKNHFNGFASEEEYERVLAVAERVIGDDADAIDVMYECETIMVVTEHGRYHVGLGEGVFFIDLPDTFLCQWGLLVYEDLNDAEDELYDAMEEE